MLYLIVAFGVFLIAVAAGYLAENKKRTHAH
jgi:hypothetical protein